MNYRFNLQPWREQARQQAQKTFIAITVGVVVATIGLLAANYYVETSYIDDQNEAKSFLQTEVDKLQSAKNKVQQTKDLIKEVSKQIQAVEQLQANRATALQFLDYISVNLPDSVFLNRIIFSGKDLAIEGVAENDSGVADFMRMLQRTDLLDGIVLRGIQTAQSTGRYVVADDSETKAFTVNTNLNYSNGGSSETR